MNRTTATRLFAAAALTGSAGIAAITGAGSASASGFNTTPLAPGQATCVSQYAGYQVRAEGWATGQGARFKLLRNGQVLDATPGRVNNWATERRTAYNNFPGPGSYSVCAYNTGTTNTTVTLQIRTDSEI